MQYVYVDISKGTPVINNGSWVSDYNVEYIMVMFNLIFVHVM